MACKTGRCAGLPGRRTTAGISPTISSGAATTCACAAEEWEARVRCCRRPSIDVVVVGEALPRKRRRSTCCGGMPAATARASSCCSGTADLIDKVLALELGAADVVDSAGQLARTRRPHRRPARRGAARARRELVALENSTVDLKAGAGHAPSGEEEQLSPGQVALLRLFLANPRKVLTRDDIMAAAPAESADAFDRSIDSRIVRLRRKLDTESIATIRGSGYRFDPPSPGQR